MASKHFYIGDPDPKDLRGQDKNGMVHCQLWLYFRKDPEYGYSLRNGGGLVGSAQSPKHAQHQLHAYARGFMKQRIDALAHEMARAVKAMDDLGTDPNNLNKFVGPFKERS